MSRSPIGSSEPVSAPRKTWRGRARTAPRVWVPTIARRAESGFFSAISWAIRRSVRLKSSCSSTTFSLTSVASFLASRDRVKGRLHGSTGGGGPGEAPPGATAGGGAGGGLPRAFFLHGSVGNEMGCSSLWEGELDLVEIARGDGWLEDLFCLFDHLADVVAGG